MLKRKIFLFSVIFLFSIVSSLSHAAVSYLGKEFWLAIPGNYNANPTLVVNISSASATSGTIDVPALGLSYPFTVSPGTVFKQTLPSTAQIMAADGIQNIGIHVTALADVAVYVVSKTTASSDAYTGLPVNTLGTDYRVLAYRNGVINGSQFTVIAAENATTVTITPQIALTGHPAGTPYTVTLQQGEVYQFSERTIAGGDVTGTHISSDKPVGVYGGQLCANVPAATTACDYIVEQLTPTPQWGTQFLAGPLASRTRATYRVLADVNGTSVTINEGGVVQTVVLNQGDFFEWPTGGTLTGVGAVSIQSTSPVLLAQYSRGTSDDGKPGDPFMILIPPIEQYLQNYTVVALESTQFPSSYATLIAPTSGIASVTMNGTPVPPASFLPITGSTYSYAQVTLPVAAAPTDYAFSATVPFMVTVYGFGSADSYGYFGGAALTNLSLASIKSVTDANGNGIAEPGELLTYRIQITNSGSSNATAMTASDVLPSDVTFVSADNGGTHSAGTVNWSGLNVPANGGTLTLTLVVRVNNTLSSTSITNQATVAGDPTCAPGISPCAQTTIPASNGGGPKAVAVPVMGHGALAWLIALLLGIAAFGTRDALRRRRY